jgi:hypothetical protein
VHFKEADKVIIVFVLHLLDVVYLEVLEIREVIIVVTKVANSILPKKPKIISNIFLPRVFERIPDLQAQSQSSFVYRPLVDFYSPQFLVVVVQSLFFLKNVIKKSHLTN